MTNDRFDPLVILAWFIAAALGLAITLITLYPEGTYQPYHFLGIDSFYHASRILDVVAGQPFSEWDTRGYYPDGAWIAWPWAYDYVLALAARAWLALTGTSPVTLLIYLPSYWFAINIAMIGLICRDLKLSRTWVAVAMLSFALLPANQQLHLAGRIDHHFAELFAVLALTLALVRFGTSPTRSAGLLLGITLGLAPGINNGLFLLQVPVALFVAACWLRGHELNRQGMIALSISLVVTTLLVCLPSVPFQQLEFKYYLLSWFHLYISLATGVMLIVVAHTGRTIAGFAILTIAAFVLASPLLGSTVLGLGYLAAANFTPMETDSIFTLNLPSLSILYSPLIFMAPLAVTGLMATSFREHTGQMALAIYCVFGLLMLIIQQRFALYGTPALILPLAIVGDQLTRRFTNPGAQFTAGAIIIAASGYATVQAIPHHNLNAWNPDYFKTLPALLKLRESCQRQPGLVLADPNHGHYILYFTNCQVLSNNAAITTRHLQARATTRRLLALSPEDLLATRDDIQYVLVTRFSAGDASMAELVQQANQQGLYGAMLKPNAKLPPPFKLMVSYSAGSQEDLPITRLYQVDRHGTND